MVMAFRGKSQSSDEIEIFRSKVPGQGRMVWKCKWTMSSKASASEIMQEFVDWERRLKHDENFAQGARLKTFADGYYIDQCHTKQVLTVSPRELLQLHNCRLLSDGLGYVHTFTSVTSQDMAGLPGPVKGIVRAENLPGCGMRVTLVPAGLNSDAKDWLLEVVVENDPSGWLPSAVVNSAMTMQFTDQARGSVKHFGSLPASMSA